MGHHDRHANARRSAYRFLTKVRENERRRQQNPLDHTNVAILFLSICTK